MAFLHGKNTEVLLDGVDVSAQFNSVDLSADIEPAETTTFKKSWKTFIAGVGGSTLTLGGFYDPTHSEVRNTLQAASGSVLTVGPGGMSAVGDMARTLQVRSTNLATTAPIGGVVAFSWQVIADGSAGFGVVLAPLTARTTTGTGTSNAGPVGGTTNGAVAHLHVTAISGASASATVVIEHSTNNSTWSTLGTFGTRTTTGAERITINGTVNRYLRATWTISGTSPSVTFAVAMART